MGVSLLCGLGHRVPYHPARVGRPDVCEEAAGPVDSRVVHEGSFPQLHTFALIHPDAILFQPDGSLPAYEWDFSDVNPPVHAWATFRVFKIERKLFGKEDVSFLESVFQKLLLNFTWFVTVFLYRWFLIV